jgi:hypothetical protein
MRIVAHILWKDLRRHWIEIGLYGLSCGSWGWDTVHPLSWLHQRGFSVVALFGLWVLITIRAVHGECVVGDREFWQTRPYTGVQLLTAKILFLILCLNVPLLVTQIFLLIYAGIPMTLSIVPDLLLLQLEFAFLITFPVFAIAAVTESLIQWILAVGGLILFGLMMTWLPWNSLPETLSGQENIGTLAVMGLTVPALLLAIVWQYTRRNPALARVVICLAALSVVVGILVAHANVVRNIAYAQSKELPPFQILIRPQDGSSGHEYFRTKGEFSEDTIDIPIDFASTDPDLDVDLEGMRILLTGDNGWKWQSAWMNRALSLSPASPGGAFEFQMRSDLADQIPQVHAEASVELAYREHRFGRAKRIDTSPRRFPIPLVGICTWFESGSDKFSRTHYDCVAPLRLPGMLLAEIDSGDSTCPAEEGPPVPAVHDASSTINGLDGVLVDLEPDPVRRFNFNFGKWSAPVKSVADPKDDRNATLCRGMPISVRSAGFVGRMQSKFNLGPIGAEKLKTNEELGVVPFDMRKR